jgi:putative peptidoglycan lipid II flippase
MVAALFVIRMVLADWFAGSVGHRLAGVIAIVSGGMAVYFPLVWVLGGTDKDELRALIKRRRPYTDAG